MKNIGLTKGYLACVDDADHEWLSRFRWSANVGDSGKVYPVTRVSGVNRYMHRVILGLGKRRDDKRVVDHIDGDTLNNTRANLRICTPSQNAMNSRKAKNAASRYKGVQTGNGKWTASINSEGEKFFLGTFENEVLAAISYNQKARDLHKDFAWLNPIHFENEILVLLDRIEESKAKIAELVKMELEGSV